jgi:hypothetical protein
MMAFLYNDGAQRVVTLEVFGQEDLDESLRVMSRYIPGGRALPSK